MFSVRWVIGSRWVESKATGLACLLESLKLTSGEFCYFSSVGRLTHANGVQVERTMSSAAHYCYWIPLKLFRWSMGRSDVKQTNKSSCQRRIPARQTEVHCTHPEKCSYPWRGWGWGCEPCSCQWDWSYFQGSECAVEMSVSGEARSSWVWLRGSEAASILPPVGARDQIKPPQ